MIRSYSGIPLMPRIPDAVSQPDPKAPRGQAAVNHDRSDAFVRHCKIFVGVILQ